MSIEGYTIISFNQKKDDAVSVSETSRVLVTAVDNLSDEQVRYIVDAKDVTSARHRMKQELATVKEFKISEGETLYIRKQREDAILIATLKHAVETAYKEGWRDRMIYVRDTSVTHGWGNSLSRENLTRIKE